MRKLEGNLRTSAFSMALLMAPSFALSLAIASPAAAQNADALKAARDYRSENGAAIIRDFADLLAIPNVAADPGNLARNADRIEAMFAARGFAMEQFRIDGAAPLVFGERKTDGATRTIAIYIHYDGQPVAPENWTSPPFTPTLYSKAIIAGGEPIDLPRDGATIDEEWRIYARSASDDKAPVIALSAALDALDKAGVALTSNIILIFDGEEESGSVHLPRYLAENAAKFSGVDLWLFVDGPTHQSGAAQLQFGARGIAGLELTVYGPNRALHSGHYGNWAPGPGWRLARLLATMKDDDGRVTIKDFYKSAAPITKADRAAIAAMPPVDDDLRGAFGLAQTEMHNAPLAERILLPALNLRGLESAKVGAATANIIPTTATASFDLRLVEGNDPKAMLDLVEAHIRRQGYLITREEPTAEMRKTHPLIARVTREEGYPAVRSQIDDPAFAPLIAALKGASEDLSAEGLVLAPSSGGTLPLYMFRETKDAPIIALPIVNFDNNQHAADENIRIRYLFYGIDAFAAALTMD